METKFYLRSKRVFIFLSILFFSIKINAQKQLQNVSDFLKKDARISSFEMNPKLGTPSFISFSDKSKFSSTETFEVIKEYFNLKSANNNLKSIDKVAVSKGISIEKVKHYFKGIPVEHSAYSVVSKDGKIFSIAAESYDLGVDFTSRPSLSNDAARAKALEFVNAKQYAWEALEVDKANIKDNPTLQKKLSDLKEEYYPKGDLVIAKDVYGSGQPKLAWKFNIYATAPLGRYNIYIDALNGKLLLRDMIIKHAGEEKPLAIEHKLADSQKEKTESNFSQNIAIADPSKNFKAAASVLGTAHTRYAGIKDIYTTKISVPVGGTADPNNTSVQLKYSGTDPRTPILLAEDVYILKDDIRGGGVETYDMNAAGGAPISLPGLHALSLAFVDRDVTTGSKNVWKNETATGTNEDHVRGATMNGANGADEGFNDDFALDAHWGAEMVYDYWKNVHGRFSYDNKNTAIKSYVHYGPAYDNAFWNGSVMTYGDGSGTGIPVPGFKPLTSLDVCGHEIGHGVCSFTSDLVYESESGAMNEGLSDIWAAAIERFVIATVDPSLASIYKPFYIGEQIASNPETPLRRMDNPKARTDPDTFGGQFWADPNCTPTLANDQCGVHTNSGVLNKYFYLLSVGSGNGSGPDASFVTAGVDDGKRDASAALLDQNTIPYMVTGIGFEKAEKITYLMELMLTPNAKFSEARAAAINAAIILYGECSQEHQSVMNAFNGVGVGPKFATCTLATISASSLITDVKETAGGLDCERFNEYNINVNLTTAQLSPTTVSFTIGGASTMSPDEYALSSTSIVYGVGETGFRTVKLRIFDDAMIEADETIVVNVASTTPALNQTFTFTVRNDDVTPSIGGTQTLIDENFETFTVGPFAAPTPTTWGKVDKLPGNVQWAARAGTTSLPPIVFTTKRAIIEMTAPVALPGQALYDQVTIANTILRTPLVNANGLKSVNVKFKYQVGGEPACEPACDYGRLLFSFDGINFSSFADSPSLFLSFTESDFEFNIPASFDGKQFYLGVQWYNDPNAGTSGSIAIDNFIVTAKGKEIETKTGDKIAEKINSENGKPSFFYSSADGEIISKITNNSGFNYGCMEALVVNSGTSSFNFYVDGTVTHKVASKVVKMTPALNNTSGQYNIGIYFTEAEIAGYEAASGYDRNSLFIYKTSAASFSGASSANTARVAATYTAIPGYGGLFSANFATGFSIFALGSSNSSPLPVNCIDFSGLKVAKTVNLKWRVADEKNNANFNVEKSSDGIKYFSIGNVKANAENGGNYSFIDNAIGNANVLYYRLIQNDSDGKSQYTCKTIAISNELDANFKIGKISPNPSNQMAKVNIYSANQLKLQMDYLSVSGQLISTQFEQLNSGDNTLILNEKASPTGTYFVIFKNEKGEILGSQKYFKFK